MLDASYRHLQAGDTAIRAAQDDLSSSSGTGAGSTVPLREAGAAFGAARGLLGSPILAPLDIVPVLGRQLGAVRELAGDATGVAQVGVGAVAESQAILDLPHQGGEDRVVTLQRLAALAARTRARLAPYRPRPAQALAGPVASAHDTYSRLFAQAEQTLGTASEAAAATATLLQGPSTYLLLASNNAEMRAGSGTALDAGVITASGGSLSVSQLTDTSALALAPGQVPVSGDLEARWGFLRPGVDWRNLGLTPQFDVNGALAARMWQADTGQHVDGVLAVDVGGLQTLLTVTGPVTTADGTVVSAGNVETYLFHDQYAGIGYDDSTPAAQAADAARHEKLGSLAEAVLQQLEQGSLDLRALARAATSATTGRHLMLWAADPTTESAWAASGVAGLVQPDSILTALVNRGGNKLDQYVSVADSLALTPGPGSTTNGTMTVTLANSTPPGQSPYIAGPYPGLGDAYGDYVGYLAVTLPGTARGVSVEGTGAIADGPQGPTWLVAVTVSLAPGQARRMVVHFALPGRHGRLALVPSARIPPETWTYGSQEVDDSRPATFSW